MGSGDMTRREDGAIDGGRSDTMEHVQRHVRQVAMRVWLGVFAVLIAGIIAAVMRARGFTMLAWASIGLFAIGGVGLVFSGMSMIGVPGWHGYQFLCPHCGGGLREVPEPGGSMACPHCGGTVERRGW